MRTVAKGGGCGSSGSRGLRQQDSAAAKDLLASPTGSFSWGARRQGRRGDAAQNRAKKMENRSGKLKRAKQYSDQAQGPG